MKTIRIFISGVVQGISFRAFVREEAEKLDLRGYVRNLEDGRVEAVVEGKDKDVEKMIELCKKGSLYSRVEKVEVKKIKNQGFKEFKILRF